MLKRIEETGKQTARWGNRRRGGAFVALLLGVVAVGAVGCGGEAPSDARATDSPLTLNPSSPGHGSGLLWVLPDGELHVWDTLNATSYQDFFLGAPDPTVWQVAGTGDFNGDGQGDILWIDRRDQLLSLWELSDTRPVVMTPGTQNAPQYFSGPGVAGTGDIDGDGITDVVWAGTLTPGVARTETWLMSRGSTTPKSTTIVDSSTDVPLGVGNFDGDSLHRAEILRRANDGTVTVALNGGSPTVLGAAARDWVYKGVGDFNGDQTSDVLWQNSVTGDISIWLMSNGAISVGTYSGTVTPDSGWSIQRVGDVDHDGISDIVWKHVSGLVSIWLMNPDGWPREYGAGLPIDPSSGTVGVVDLGSPPAPANVRVGSEYIQNGTTWIDVYFDVSPERTGDQVAVFDTSVKSVKATPTPWSLAWPGTAHVLLDASRFQAGSKACFKMKEWEQGRVSGYSSSVCAPGLSPPVASFDWSMPAMFGGDADGDGAIDLVPPLNALTSLYYNQWTVNFDACASSDPAGGAITDYSWSISNATGPTPITDSTSCKLQATLAQGPYTVSLTVGTQDGRRATVTQNINVRNFLIVSLGDSYASGEGNPLRPFSRVGYNGPVTPAFWGTTADWNCHRSANAGPARAALGIERSDPHSSVTFLSTACSGAGIPEIIDTPDTGPGTVDIGYDGFGSNAPQLEQVRDWLCPFGNCAAMPKIDAVVVSIGGNDAGFGDIIFNCMIGGGLLGANCSADEDFAHDTYQKICDLDSKAAICSYPDPFVSGITTLPTAQQGYPRLASAIASNLNYAHVYMTEYPDPTNNAQGTTCDEFVLKNALAGFDGEIGKEDLQWMSFNVLWMGINSAMSNAAHDLAGTYNWSYVGSISKWFNHAGYCADPHMFIRYDESEGLLGEKYGTLHPNLDGHGAYAYQILQALIADGIGTPAALESAPYHDVVLPQYTMAF